MPGYSEQRVSGFPAHMLKDNFLVGWEQPQRAAGSAALFPRPPLANSCSHRQSVQNATGFGDAGIQRRLTVEKKMG